MLGFSVKSQKKKALDSRSKYAIALELEKRCNFKVDCNLIQEILKEKNYDVELTYNLLLELSPTSQEEHIDQLIDQMLTCHAGTWIDEEMVRDVYMSSNMDIAATREQLTFLLAVEGYDTTPTDDDEEEINGDILSSLIDDLPHATVERFWIEECRRDSTRKNHDILLACLNRVLEELETIRYNEQYESFTLEEEPVEYDTKGSSYASVVKRGVIEQVIESEFEKGTKWRDVARKQRIPATSSSSYSSSHAIFNVYTRARCQQALAHAYAAVGNLIKNNPGIYVSISSSGEIFYHGLEANSSKGIKLDLHGLYVSEATGLAFRCLEYYRNNKDSKVSNVSFIVGKGLHSPMGISRLGPFLSISTPYSLSPYSLSLSLLTCHHGTF